MNAGPKWRRCAILMQTLVISALLCIISVSVMRWVLNRYMHATRISNSTIARGAGLGGAMLLFSQWNTNVWPSNPSGSDSFPINAKPLDWSFVSSYNPDYNTYTSARTVTIQYPE